MESNNNFSILAFDYGLKNIGCAVAQSSIGVASPLKIIRARDGVPKNWNEIRDLVTEWRPQLLVVGNPLNMDDTENEIGQRVKKFCYRLKGRFNLPVELVDERLSTREAKKIALSCNYQSTNFKKNPVDLIAACLILESYFSRSD